ncbi:MAG TPA: transketolase [Alphaproteobacteria bacterium]
MTTASYQSLATALRFLAVDGVEKAKSGHPGLPLGMADVATVLFRDFLKFDVTQPDWPDRDRFILSAGHGSMLLYALSYLTGYKAITLDDLKNFRQLHSRTPGHPEHDIAIGIEMTTGPLGQGIATSAGFALAEQILQARFGKDIVNHKTWVIASDGDMMEGISHEACSLAGHLQLGHLNVLYDSNQISIDGDTSLSFTENVGDRFKAYGWHVVSCDGHNVDDIKKALQAAADETGKPTLVICKTTIGFGSPNKAGSHDVHGSPLGDAEMKATREALGWTHEPFHVPDDLLAGWRAIGTQGKAIRENWEKNLSSHAERTQFEAYQKGDVPDAVTVALKELKDNAIATKPAQATRKSSSDALEKIVPAMPFIIGGSADLTPSNNTRTKEMRDIKPHDYAGNYVRYGVREHGMAAIMNGMALHGGLVPYAGTFFTFSDYSRPAIRLAALMQQRVIHVMTHDSIGLGEDGPTHQPVEHLAAVRAIPNVQVLRPADLVETIECWELALAKKDAPTILALSRQNVPALRDDATENLSARGGYILQDAAKPDVVLIATGTEVSLAVDVAKALAEKGKQARVVSMPCREIFLQQSAADQQKILGNTKRIVIEAGIKQGWEGILGADGIFCGVDHFGLSAPYQQVYAEFGLTVEAILKKLSA